VKHLVPVGFLILAIARPAASADLEKLVPADADVVIVMDVGKILDSPILKKYVPEVVAKYGYSALEQVATEDAQKKAMAEKRAEIEKILSDREESLKLLALLGGAVDRIVVAAPTSAPEQAVVAVEGEWDQETAEGLLTLVFLIQPGDMRIVKEKGRKLFEIKSDDGDKVYCAVPDDGLIVFAQSSRAVHDAFDRLDDKKPGAGSAMRKFLHGMDEEAALHIFADNAAEGIRAEGGVTIDEDVEAEIAVEVKDADKADALDKGAAEGLAGLRAAVDKADGPAAKVLSRVLRGVARERDGKTIRYKMTISAGDLDALVKAVETPEK
jgi:hypothetical protein